MTCCSPQLCLEPPLESLKPLQAQLPRPGQRHVQSWHVAFLRSHALVAACQDGCVPHIMEPEVTFCFLSPSSLLLFPVFLKFKSALPHMFFVLSHIPRHASISSPFSSLLKFFLQLCHQPARPDCCAQSRTSERQRAGCLDAHAQLFQGSGPAVCHALRAGVSLGQQHSLSN